MRQNLTAFKRLSPVLVAGVAVFLGVLTIGSFPLRLEPGSAAWSRLVYGAGPKGTITDRAQIRLPGIDRGASAEILFRLGDREARPTLGVSVDVFENHPHLAFPLLFASGLWSRRAQILCGVAMVSFLVNLLLGSGLGRFYGNRYLVLEPLAGWLAGLRTAPGFDFTLVLALVNTAVLIALFVSLKGELEALSTLEAVQ